MNETPKIQYPDDPEADLAITRGDHEEFLTKDELRAITNAEDDHDIPKPSPKKLGQQAIKSSYSSFSDYMRRMSKEK